MNNSSLLNIPNKMKALVLTEFNAKPELTEVDTPTPTKSEVLIKIDSSPVNPSDSSFIRGMYSSKKSLPVIPGFEASGTVVATGNGFMSKRLLGKRVACFAPIDGNGTWAEYMVTRNNFVIPLKKGVDLEQGSMLMVNPLSVVAMLDIAKKGKHRAIANTAAASALGQMMNKLCLEKKLPIVNIVRREEQVTLLKQQGAKYIVNSSDNDFLTKLSKIFHELNVTIAFDAVSGDMTFNLIEALPVSGEVMVYGGLSEQACITNPGKLIFEKKKLSGFWASEWINQQNIVNLLLTFNKIQKYISSGNHTTIHKRVSLDNAVEGISTYLDNMTLGKVLVKPIGVS